MSFKIALTELGSNYFIKNKKQLRRFKLVDNSENHGVFRNRVLTRGKVYYLSIISKSCMQGSQC